jgi:acetyl esterase
MQSMSLQLRPETTPEQARAAMLALIDPDAPRHPVFDVTDRTVPGPAGAIPVRVYRPSAEADRPVVVWFHGGGWALCNLETHDHLCRQLCTDLGAVVVSVDYRLAPEHPFPGPLDDCVAAYAHVASNTAEFHGDAHRIAIGGDSAGGNLAAAACLLLRDGAGPLPRAQLLVYPVTDYEFESRSMRDNATGYFLEADDMRWFYDQYCPDGVDRGDWRVSPLRAPDVTGLPRALVVTAELDPLRDQGEAYAERLRDAGVDARYVRADGLWHGCFGLHDLVPPARAVWDDALTMLRDALALEGS